MSPLDDLSNLDTSEEEVIEPLGLANPLLPPEPLGQEPLYPQFLMPVAAVPLMAANPAVFFPEGLPGYQPPDNTFQESPFFIQAREALRPRPIEVLLEVSPRAPRSIRSELLNELAPPEDFEELLESPDIEAALASPLVEELQAPTIGDIPALEELLEEEESNVAAEAIEAEELLEVQPAIDMSALSPEIPSTPISIPEENLIPDSSPTEAITTNLISEEAELLPARELSTTPFEPELPIELPPVIETPEVLEPEIVSELPALSTDTTAVSQETEPLPAGELSAVLTESELPQAVETSEVIAPEITAELPALLADAEELVLQESASPLEIPVSLIPPAVAEEEETPEVATDVINPEPELEETLQAPEPAEVQTAVEETEEPILESPAIENAELLESPVFQEIEVPEEIPPIIESSAEGAEPPPELSGETPIESSEQTSPEVLETPIPTSEILPEEPEEVGGIVSESSPLEEAAESAVTTSASAISLPVEIMAEAPQREEEENAETSPSEEQLPITEEVPVSIESEGPPPEVTPEVEPKNLPEEAIAAISEPLAASAQEMAVPIVEEGLENVPETEVSPLISRRQEFLEEQIEVFSGLEPEELGLEEGAFAPENAGPEVPQESNASPETEIAETPALGIPAPVPMPLEAATEVSPETPLIEEESENLSIPNQSEVLGTQAEENLEVIPSLPTILENLGILTSLITSSPLTQLSNFLPISSEPFSSGRQRGMPFGLEQPMTFASPNIQRQIIMRREESSVALTPTPEPSLLITPNPPEPSEQNAPTENQSVENTQETVKSETATDETITTEASASPIQEELLQSLEEEIPLPIVTALSVMRSSGNYIPLTFAPRPATRSRSTAQQERASSFSTQENIPTEWSSIEELIRGNSFSSSEELISSVLNPESTNLDNWENLISHDADRNYIPSEGEEEQEYSSVAMPLEDSDEELVEISEEDEEFSLDNSDEDERNEPDLEYLAQEIYSILQQRLSVERERQGFHSGRLPW
jgi:hypothetical protein